MAGTIQVALKIAETYGSKVASQQNTIDIAVASNIKSGGTILVTEVGQGELIPLGEVTVPCLMWVRNYDVTNYIQVGKDNAGNLEAFTRLLPNTEMFLIIDAAIVPRVKANVAACEMEFKLWRLTA